MNDQLQVTVSIGRNVGHVGIAGRPQCSVYGYRTALAIAPGTFGKPMSAYRWSEYRREVTALLMGIEHAYIIGRSNGRSHFTLDGEDVSESSYTVYVGGVEPRFYQYLKVELAVLAHKYGQDSIAVTVADPMFIIARNPSTEQ